MAWPLASHFSAMLQNPKVAFRDPRLRGFRIEKDALNQPRPWSGQFAVVYKGTDSDGKTSRAIRVFTTESPDRRERYDRISEYLQTRKLACLVDFEYRDNSIRSAGDGRFYPMVLMDWVSGETLFHWARGRCLSGDCQTLAQVAERWIAVVQELAAASIAHGDLQHANVMVTDAGQVKLVDYDGMCVPALVGRRNLEVGVEPYQHPDRGPATLLSLDLDNYSALVIYVALRALAADPGLWIKYVEQPGHDKLLFRTEDLRLPAGSPLCYDIQHSPDGEVRELLQRLIEAGQARIDQVPALAEVGNSYGQIEQLLDRQQWEAAVALLNRRKQFRDAPPRLKPLIEEAYQHVRRAGDWKKFLAVPLKINPQNDRQLAQAWNDPLFADFPPAREHRARARGARQRIDVLDQVRPTLDRSGPAMDIQEEQAITAAAARLPRSYLAAWQPRVELAQRRVEAIAGLERALQEPIHEMALIAAWQKVVAAEAEALADPARLPRIELAERRAAVLTALGRIPPNLAPDDLDHHILAVWREDLLGDCTEVASWQETYRAAVRRQDLVRRLQTAVDGRRGAEIVELVQDPCLENYPFPPGWKPIIKSAREKIARTRRLVTVLSQQQRNEFLAAFDVRLLVELPEQFRAYRAILADWAAAELRIVEHLGLSPAVGRASLVRLDDPPGAYRVRWTWPPTRFSEECLLAVCAESPGLDDDPRLFPACERLVTTRPMWETSGGSRLLESQPSWAGAYVVVWAKIDLGFLAFYSHPLVLGRIEPPPRGWRRWRLFARAAPATNHGRPASGPLLPREEAPGK